MEIEEDWGDGEWPEEDWPVEDYRGDDVSDTVECRECGADVYEDAECCPVCGNYVVHGSSGYLWKNRPVWWIVLGLLGILAVIVALTLGPI